MGPISLQSLRQLRKPQIVADAQTNLLHIFITCYCVTCYIVGHGKLVTCENGATLRLKNNTSHILLKDNTWKVKAKVKRFNIDSVAHFDLECI